MLRSATVGLIAFLFPLMLNAQKFTRPLISFPNGMVQSIRLQAGPSLFVPSFYFKPSTASRQVNLGVATRLGISHYFKEHFEFNAAAGLERLRYKTQSTRNPGPVQQYVVEEVKNNYWLLDLSCGYAPGENPKFAVAVGPSVALLANSKTTAIVRDDVNGIFSFSTVDTKNRYSKFDAGISFSARYTVSLTSRIGIDLMVLYRQGIASVNRDETLSIISLKKNNTINMLLGLRFEKAKKKTIK